jgi:hypothetical protein
MPWNYRRYGSAADPIHKSHLNAITGDFGCPRQFRYMMDARADGAHEREHEARGVSGKAACGTAAHETIARALTHPTIGPRVLAGPNTVTNSDVAKVFTLELEREAGGRTIEWYDDNAATLIADRVSMITGLLNDLHAHVAKIELIEPGFIVRRGPYWMCGHIDLVYRPKHDPRQLGLADWKTGATKPDAIELDHGWEAGIYSAALESGYFLPRESIECVQCDGYWLAKCGPRATASHASRYIAERNALELALMEIATLIELGTEDVHAHYPLLTRFERFPDQIHHVHLGDYVPYKKAGSREIKRPEDLRYYGFESPRIHKFVAGERRGPAWLPVRRTEHDLPRLDHRLRNIVGMIRMGRFIDQVGERCKRCAYQADCLNSGYAPTGDERAVLEQSLRGIEGDDGLGGTV